MNKQKSLTNIFGSEHRADVLEAVGVATTLALSVFIVLLRVLAYLFYYDKSVGYFVSGNPLSVAAYILMAIGILIVVSMLFLPSNSEKSTKEPQRASKLAPAPLLAVCTCLLMIIDRLSALDGISDTACVIAYGLACVYFSADLFDPKSQRLTNGVRVICGYALLVGIGISITDIYFDRYIPMNNPDKVLLIFVLLFDMLYLTAEYRYLLGIPKRNLSVSFSSASMLTGFSFSISYLTAYIFGTLENGSYLVYALASLMFSLYIFIKTIERKKAHQASESTKEEDRVETLDSGKNGCDAEVAEQTECSETTEDNLKKEQDSQ